jgi:hypothetical protein
MRRELNKQPEPKRNLFSPERLALGFQNGSMNWLDHVPFSALESYTSFTGK